MENTQNTFHPHSDHSEVPNFNIFDPFLHLKGNDSANNPMHTSKRTLENKNNLVSDTYKVIHNMLTGRKLTSNGKLDPKALRKFYMEKMELDMSFIQDYIHTITLEAAQNYTQNVSEEQNVTHGTKFMKDNEDLSTVNVDKNSVKLRPNYTASSFYTPKITLKEKNFEDAQAPKKTINNENTHKEVNLENMKHPENILKNQKNPTSVEAKIVIPEEKKTKQVANSPIKIKNSNDYQDDLDLTTKKLVSYNVLNSRRNFRRNFQSAKLGSARRGSRGPGNYLAKSIPQKNFLISIPKSESKIPKASSLIIKEKVNK